MKYPLAVIVLMGTLMAGCISATPPAQAGVRIGEETLRQFKPGVTTETWLVAVLGKPSSTSVVEGIDNTRVLRYATSESAGGIGALLSGSGTRNTAVVYFIVTDRLVTRFWADRAVDHDLLGQPVEVPLREQAR